MKAAEMFNECHARYRGLHEWLDDSLGQVRALDLDSPSAGYQWRPERSRACEYVADFERIGRHALKRPQWKGRLKLFEIYFLGGTDYRRAISLGRSSRRHVRLLAARSEESRGTGILAHGIVSAVPLFSIDARESCCRPQGAIRRSRGFPPGFSQRHPRWMLFIIGSANGYVPFCRSW